MKTVIKITEDLHNKVHVDLRRAHPFAHERVGFLTAGAMHTPDGGVVLLCRNYYPVDDEDYERCRSVGAQIGSEAMRKAIESAYAHKSSLIHIHTHGGCGQPRFSRTDLDSALEFVPGFFNALPRMPHGLIVLSNDSARGLLWTNPQANPQNVNGFVRIGAGVRKYGSENE